MSTLTVKFIDKEYSFPRDVLTYIDLLSFTDSIQKQLVGSFIRKLKNEIAKDNIGLLGNEDLSTEIEHQVGKFIAKLCDNGIFTRTISDYLKNNKGYQLYSDVNKSAFEKIKSLLMSELDELKSGYESAVSNAESQVTGMGFSIWSSSFVNHAIYAAMEASTLKKQSKEAEVQYQKDMSDLRSRLDSKYGGEKRNYINNTYIPNMEATFTVLAYELLDKYVADLIANGKFDGKTLDYIDIGRSNDLLKNLTLSNNKKAILENAFVACPYNIDVYMEAMKMDMLDKDTFETANIFKQSGKILDFLRNNLGEISYPQRFRINYHYVELLAIFTEQSFVNVLHSLTDVYVSEIVSAYSNINKMLHNEDLCRKAIKGYAIEQILAGKSIASREANRRVKSIVSDNIWEQLVNKCGYSNLFDLIKNASFADTNTTRKSDLDNILIEKLEQCLETARLLLVPVATKQKQEIENNEKAQEEKRIKLAKKCNIIQIVCKVLLPILIIVPLVLRFVLVGIWCGDVKAFVNEHVEAQLEEELAKSDSYANKIGLTGEFAVNKIEYYKSEYSNFITVVPHITIYSSEEENFYTSYADIVLRYVNYDETEAIARPWYIVNDDEWELGVNFHITVVCEDGSEVTCYENYEEDDTRFFAYLPFGTLIIFAVYAIIVVIVIKKIKQKYTIQNLQKND